MERKNEMDLEITQVIVNVVSIRNSSDVFRFFFFFQIAVVSLLSKRVSNALPSVSKASQPSD